MPKEITIGPYKIGTNHPPFIIAELSGNHQGSLKHALELIDAAKAAGVHAIKLQTYTPDTLTLDAQQPEFLIDDPASLWYGRTLYDLYQEAYTPWEWHEPIFTHCRNLGLATFSTPFDETAVDFLANLNVDCYKIASLEIVDIPLIRTAAKQGKPLLISTGGATLAEITTAVDAARQAGCQDIVLLKCTSAYPASPADMNLYTIPHLASTFGVLAGLSDHTLGIGVPLAAVALGCTVIEKHLTMDRAAGGVDSAFSLEPHEFELLVKESRVAWEALGRVSYGPLASEKTSLSHRPSLYFVEDLSAGEIVMAKHVRSVRPGNGLPPEDIDIILGLRVAQAVKKNTAVSWNHFKN